MKRVSSPIVACDRVNLIRAFNLQTAHPREPFQPRSRYKHLTAMMKNYVVTAHPALRLFGRNIRIEMPFAFPTPSLPPHWVCLGSFVPFRFTRSMTNDNNNNNYNNPDRRTSARIFNYNIIASRKRALEIFNRVRPKFRFVQFVFRRYFLAFTCPFVACSSPPA